MRRRAHRALSVVLASAGLFCGCGGLDNDPLRVGGIRGRVLGAETPRALVAVSGAPALRSTLASDGAFEIRDVPLGEHDLLVIGSATTAARVRTRVRAGAMSDVGEVAPLPGAWLLVSVDESDVSLAIDARISVVGTPWVAIPFDPAVGLRLGPMPEGCYVVEARGPMAKGTADVCLQSEEEESVTLDFSESDDGQAASCLEVGCAPGYECSDEGRCEECDPDKVNCSP